MGTPEGSTLMSIGFLFLERNNHWGVVDHFCLQVHLLDSQVTKYRDVSWSTALKHLSQKIILLLPQSLEYFDSHPQPETCQALAKIHLKKNKRLLLFLPSFFSLLYILLMCAGRFVLSPPCISEKYKREQTNMKKQTNIKKADIKKEQTDKKKQTNIKKSRQIKKNIRI